MAKIIQIAVSESEADRIIIGLDEEGILYGMDKGDHDWRFVAHSPTRWDNTAIIKDIRGKEKSNK